MLESSNDATHENPVASVKNIFSRLNELNTADERSVTLSRGSKRHKGRGVRLDKSICHPGAVSKPASF